MDQGKERVNEGDRVRLEDLARKADSVRAELDRLLGELRRRGQAALDWRQRLKAHPLIVALPLAALVGAALAALLSARARRRERAPLARLLRSLPGHR
jgi:hypothetical protein